MSRVTNHTCIENRYESRKIGFFLVPGPNLVSVKSEGFIAVWVECWGLFWFNVDVTGGLVGGSVVCGVG